MSINKVLLKPPMSFDKLRMSGLKQTTTINKTARGEPVEPYERKRRKRTQPAFTLIEVMIALSLSAFIMLSLMQTYRYAMRYLQGTNAIMSDGRVIYLLFSQLEKDFSTAYIAQPSPQEKSEKDEQLAKNKDPKEKEADDKKQAALAKEDRRTSFIAQIDERADALKIEGRKLEPFKLVSFIATNPLQIYGEYKPRLVRIIYQLKPDKGQSQDQPSFTLLRKETEDVRNTFAKQDDDTPRKTPRTEITSHVVARNIKFFAIRYTYEKKEKNGDKQTTLTAASSSTWGDRSKEHTHSVVPKMADVYIQLWNEERTSWHEQHTAIPIFSYPTIMDRKTTPTETVNNQPEKPTSNKPDAKRGIQQLDQAAAPDSTQPANTPIADNMVGV